MKAVSDNHGRGEETRRQSQGSQEYRKRSHVEKGNFERFGMTLGGRKTNMRSLRRWKSGLFKGRERKEYEVG